MSALIAATVLVLLFLVVVALLENTHRHTAGLPRAPFGADVEGEADLNRILHDLDAARGRRR